MICVRGNPFALFSLLIRASLTFGLIAASQAADARAADPPSLAATARAEAPDPLLAARAAVRLIARLVQGQLARLRDPICLSVSGLGEAQDRLVEERLASRARTLGLEPGRPSCRPNVRLNVVPSAQAFVAQAVRTKAPILAGLPDGALASLTAIHAPIIVWIQTAAKGAGGESLGAAHLDQGANDTFAAASVLQGRSASLVGTQTRQDVVSGLMMIDRATAIRVSIEQLADYAAMRIFGNTTDAVPQFDSILRVFAGDWSHATALTSFDLLYLDTLYRSSPRALGAAVIEDAAARIGRANGLVYDGRTLTHPGPAPARADPEQQAEQLLEAGRPAESPSLPHEADAAADPASADNPEWIDTVTVVAPKAGPALWRVRKGKATLVLLGTVAPLPRDFKWIDWRAQSAIRHSAQMLVNNDPEVGYLYMRSWSPTAARELHQKNGRTLFAELPPPEAARFAAALAAAGQTPDRYADLRPAAAGMLLNWDWRQSSGLTGGTVVNQLVAFGRKRGVPVHFVRQTSLLTTLDELPALAPEAQARCLDKLVSNVENERTRAAGQAKAWARGDLVQLRQVYIPPATCASDIPRDARKRAAAIEAWTATLAAALDRNDQTFAIIDISSLLSRDGVLARLAALGAVIDSPPEEGFAPRPDDAAGGM